VWAPATRRMSARPVSTGARAPAPRKHTLESVLSAGLARLELERGVRATAAGEGGGEKQSGKEAVAPFYSAVRVNLRSLPVHKSAPPAEEDPGVEPPPAEDDPGKGNRKERVVYETKDGPRMWLYNRWMCEHGRIRSVCKECGGSSLCEHGRKRYFCKDCGGSGICEHGKHRTRCKE
jgi:hypothetical protein